MAALARPPTLQGKDAFKPRGFFSQLSQGLYKPLFPPKPFAELTNATEFAGVVLSAITYYRIGTTMSPSRYLIKSGVLISVSSQKIGEVILHSMNV